MAAPLSAAACFGVAGLCVAGIVIAGFVVYKYYNPKGPHSYSSGSAATGSLVTYDDLNPKASPNPPDSPKTETQGKDSLAPTSKIRRSLESKETQTTEMSDGKVSKKSRKAEFLSLQCQNADSEKDSNSPHQNVGLKKEMKDAGTQWHLNQMSVDAQTMAVSEEETQPEVVKIEGRSIRSGRNKRNNSYQNSHSSSQETSEVMKMKLEFLKLRQECLNLRRRIVSSNKNEAQDDAESFQRSLCQSVPTGGYHDHNFNIRFDRDDTFSLSLNALDVDKVDDFDDDSVITIGSDTAYPTWNDMTPEEKESQKCRVCNKKIKTITYPCKHPYMCKKCAPVFFREYKCRCPICRNMIKGFDHV